MAADLALLRDRFASDPVLLYSTGAAVLLAFVSLSSGFGRRDFLALSRSRTLLRVLGAVALAFLIEAAHALWGSSLPASVAAVTGGLHRLPLYVVALAYGPATGAAIGVLFAGFHAGAGLPGWPEAVLTLELAVLGWLAIYPSPRDHRLAGPLNALLAYALAWGTGGIALLAATRGDVTLALLSEEHAAMLPGLAACALLLPLLSPRAYRAVFPGSRIHPPAPRRRASRSRALAPAGQSGSPVLALDEPFAARGSRRDLTVGALGFEAALLPGPFARSRSRGERALAPLTLGDAHVASDLAVRERRLEPRRLPDELSR